MRKPLRMKIMAAVASAALIFACSGASNSPPPGNGESSGASGNSGAGDDGSGSGTLLGNASPDGSGGIGIQLGDGGTMRAGASPDASVTGCDPTCTTAHGTCNGSVCSLVDNSGGVDMATQAALQQGGSADSTFQWLYPYDRTVFGRGLLSPTLQFAGTSADAALVRITSMTIDYTGYFKVTQNPLSLVLPQASWDAVAAAALANDPVQVKVTKSVGGKASGPVQESWTIAKGYLRGTIYYETYNSQVAGGNGSVGLMQIQPGTPMPTALKTGCGNVCHTASADGSTLVAATTFGVLGVGASSSAYDLTNGFATIRTANDDSYTYAGLYPDGTIFMTATSYRGASGNPSRLFDTKTGSSIAAPGWDNVITSGGTVAFSPDGKQIAFVHEDKDSGHTLAKMDFDLSTHTFSNLVDLATDANNYVAWPAFTPDGKQVLYHLGSNSSFETDCGASGDLYIVDIATKTVRRLDVADGYSAGTGAASSTYLPAMDPGLNFAPTILAEAVGGYFWAIFTSHRSYGNLLASKANGTGGMSTCPPTAGGDEANGKLWVTALDIGGAPGQDVSHPAFYLDGQELTADNLRGYWVLPPCLKDGQSCMSGDQCCGGYCGTVDGGLICTSRPPPGGCSKEFDKCMTSADCCDGKDLCINGRCAQPTAK